MLPESLDDKKKFVCDAIEQTYKLFVFELATEETRIRFCDALVARFRVAVIQGKIGACLARESTRPGYLEYDVIVDGTKYSISVKAGCANSLSVVIEDLSVNN